MSSHDESPWYADGLRFRCTACGQCCTGEPGHVWVTKDEIKRIAKTRGVSTHVFKQRFVKAGCRSDSRHNNLFSV